MEYQESGKRANTDQVDTGLTVMGGLSRGRSRVFGTPAQAVLPRPSRVTPLPVTGER